MDIPKTRWATAVDGANIAYQDFGDGPVTLVVIHGWMSHIEVYWEQPRFSRFMRRLARSMRIIHFDKRGTGMSDRFDRVPDLETRMDDVRAVMDATEVDRAALLGLGTGGPPQAIFFAATHPSRTAAICIAPWIHERWSPDFPFGEKDDEWEEELEQMMATWGDEDAGAVGWFPPDDPAVIRWDAKISRYSATPRSMAALSRMWFETDVRHLLPSVHVPALVIALDEDPWKGAELAAYVAERIPAAKIARIPGGSTSADWWDEPEPYVTAIEDFLGSVHREEAALERVVATLLFTDIAGSTATAAARGDKEWSELIKRHHAIVRALLDRYRGHEVDTAGDGFFATFDGPARAVRCAQAIAEALRPLGIEIRAGVHTGEVETTGEKISGIAVHTGARVGATAAASEVLITQTVKDLTAGSGLIVEDAGEHELKGVPDRWHLYRVVG